MIKAVKIIIILLVVFFNTIAFAGTKEDVYSKLKCCNCDKQFTPCFCEHAKEMKAYIDAFLEVGLSEEEILIKIARKFGLDTIIDSGSREAVEKKLITEAGENRPQIFIEPLSYNLGEVSKASRELRFEVKLKNKGKEELKITNLKPSCPCTTIKLKKNEYLSPAFGTEGAKPGWEVSIKSEEAGELIIITDLNHASIHLGKMLRMVEVRSNDPLRPLIKIEFQAQVVE
ncbi:MAG: DUF1573 domain-containing protein [Candidatus Omnitrophica bacterium]|nr:DUF1573 domain-containing protein [Candidatus Omnitrophota bacterium]